MSEEELQQTESKQAAAGEPQESQDLGLLGEFWVFLKLNKAWWLAPILLAILLLALLAALSGTGGAPFIYSMQN